jgi:RHS repeat-associated protein
VNSRWWLGVGGTAYTYDDNGNLAFDGRFHYYYDCENRLLDVNDAAHARVASYAYDYQGRRISRTIYGSPNVTIRYVYDGAQILAEYNGAGTLRRKFVYGPGLDEPICLIDVANGNAAYYYHLDGLGSVVALSDVNNVLVERYAYDVFGRPTIRDPNGVTIAASARGNPYLFTARAYDAESGLHYYRARYYDYATGRFLQPDPTGYGDGLSLYSYCGNNPFNFSDPSGLCKESLVDRVMNAVGPYALPVTLSCLAILNPPAGLAILGFMGGMNIGQAAFTGTDLHGNPLSTYQRLKKGGVGTLEIALAFAGAAQLQAEMKALSPARTPVRASSDVGSPGSTATEVASAGHPYNPDQSALIELAKEAKRKGIGEQEAKILLDWAKEYRVDPALNHTVPPIHGPYPHIRIGQINHIEVK